MAITSTPPINHDTDIDRSRCIVTCSVVTPATDRQGEIVEPLGGIYDDYAKNPVVFFDHRATYPHAIAMAREAPGAPLQVYPSDSAVIAKHYFFQNDPVSMQMFRMIDDGMLLGISLGFNQIPEYAEPIGMRPDGKGKAFRYHRWYDLEHTHTPLGVNPETLTIAVQKCRVGSEVMLPMIVKSFQQHSLPTPVQANGWTPPKEKSMPDEKEKDDETFKKDESELKEEPTQLEKKPDPKSHGDSPENTDIDGNPSPTKPLKPSAKMLMDGAQGIRDLHGHMCKMMEMAEHPESMEAMEHVKAMLGEATEHLEGALATHHPEVKAEPPPEANEDKPSEEDGAYKVKSHRYVAVRFGPMGGKTLQIARDEAVTAEEAAEIRREIVALRYQTNMAKKRLEARA